MKKLVLLCCAVLMISGHLLSQSVEVAPEARVYRIVGKDTLRAFVFSPEAVGRGEGQQKDEASATKDGHQGTKAGLSEANEGTRAAILLFHGGAWRLWEAGWCFGRAREFAAKGMVAISIDYRLANNGLTPVDGVEDACAAFVWARQHAKELNIDGHRVAGYGVSAGGHLVAAAATLPAVRGAALGPDARPTALLLFSPALNMAQDPYFVSVMGKGADCAAYSPSEFISKALPPTLIIQGQQDSIVFTRDAISFRDAAVKAGARCELKIYPGVGHLLTRNLKVQYGHFDSDPAFVADGHEREDRFLEGLGYFSK